MGIFKDLRLFFHFKKTLKKNRVNLLSKFNMRIDNADRLYTVINIPTNLIEEPYNLRKSDVDNIAENYIRDYISELSTYLNSVGLSEMYDFYEPISKVDKYSYLIIIGYKQVDSVEINRIIYRILIPVVCVASLLSLIIYLMRF